LPDPVVFLIGVDNAVLDNHGMQRDQSDDLERAPLASRSRERHLQDPFLELVIATVSEPPAVEHPRVSD